MLRVLFLIFVISVSYHVRHVSATNTVYNSCQAREALLSHSCVRLFQQTAIANQSNVHFHYNYQDTSSDGNVAWYLIPTYSGESGCNFPRCVGGICGMREATFSGSTTLGDYPGSIELWAVSTNDINITCVSSYFTYTSVTRTAATAHTSTASTTQSALGTDALAQLYNSANGPHWRHNNNWLIGDPCGNQWYGVTCTNGQVTRLDLHYNALNGTLTSLSSLIYLERLDLSENQLSGSIPSFSGCTNLEEIDLRFNQLNGSIPSFSGCTNLEKIGLSENKLSGSIPSFSGCTNLEDIGLSGNQLSGSIPSFSGCTNLEEIRLSENKLSGSIPSFSGCTNLEDIELYSNQLSGSIPSFSGCTNLQTIDLRFNQLNGSIPSFSGCTNLQLIWLSENKLSGSIPSFSGCTNLQTIDFSLNKLSGSIPSFSGCTNLQLIELYSNQLNGSIPSFSGCTNLQTIDLRFNQLSGSIPSFSGCTNLEKIDLRFNQLNGSIPSFSGCTNLEKIWLSDNQLSGSIPSFSGCTNLEEIRLSDNQLSGSIPSFSGCTSLIYIGLSYNKLNGSIPSFSGFIDLQEIYVNHNQLTGFVPSDLFANTTEIPRFNIANNSFTCPLSTYKYCTKQRCGPCYVEGAAMTDLMNSLINQNQTNALNVATKYCKGNFALFCSLQANLENGLDLYSIQDNAVSPLSWSSYQQSVSQAITTVSAYEASIRQYETDKGQTSALLQLAHDSVNKAQSEAQVWSQAIDSTTSLMKATMSEGQTLRGQINQEFTLLDESFAELNNDITKKIQQINQQITKLSSHSFFSDMLDIIETVGGLVACCIGIPAESFVARNAFQLVGDVVDTLSAAQKVTALQGAVIQLQDYQVQLLQISNSVDSLSDMFRTINMTGNLPTVLPELEIMLIDVASLNQFVDTMAYYLHNVTAAQYLEVEVANLQTYLKSYLQLTINWYTLALKQQSYSAQQASLFDQKNTVSAQLQSAASNMLSIDASLILFESLRISATLRCVIDLLAEQRQVNYYALQNNSLSFTNPSTADLSSAQSKLTTEINRAKSQHPTGLLTMWTNFTLTAETNNGSFSSLYSTNQMMFTIDLPRPEDTKFYQVQIVQMAVYPAPIIAKQSVIDVMLSQKGLNQFYDEHFKVWNFTVPRADFPFSFSSKYPCPQISSHVPDSSYISYSPFGTWQLSLDPDQIDVSAVTEVQVFFSVNYYQSQKSGSELWGNYPFPNTERIGAFVPGCD